MGGSVARVPVYMSGFQPSGSRSDRTGSAPFAPSPGNSRSIQGLATLKKRGSLQQSDHGPQADLTPIDDQATDPLHDGLDRNL